MTAGNLYKLAEAGKLGQDMFFEGYCIAGAIDASFDTQDVVLDVYSANRAAVAEGELGQEGEATDRFYQLLGGLTFKAEQPEDFTALPYIFTNLEELRTDLAELRGKATILLDVNDGMHCVGLKPIGDNPDEWQIVGTHQIVSVAVKGEPLDVQCMIEPETYTTEQVWEYLQAENPPRAVQQTALVFPPEPPQY